MDEFYNIIELPKNSIHGYKIGSSREEKDRNEYFKKLRESFIKDGSFEKDISKNEFWTKTTRYFYYA